MKLKVYIASPYTNGWQADNVRLQLEAKHILMDNEFCPFAPLENHYAEIYRHRSEHEWFEWDIEWLKICDILVRIRSVDKDGVEIPSTGADLEEKIASEEGLLIFNFKTLEELKCWAASVNKKELVEFKNLKVEQHSAH